MGDDIIKDSYLKSMIRAFTFFDYSKEKPQPLQSVVYDGEQLKFFTFFIKGTGLKLGQIWENMEAFKKLLYENQPFYLNDFKSHVSAFNLERNVEYDAYDLALRPKTVIPKDHKSGKVMLAKIIQSTIDLKPDSWRKLFAKSGLVYQCLEDKPIDNGIEAINPTYSMDTFTGRSKTLGFNIQGTTDEFPLKSLNPHHTIFVCFDWVSVDLCLASYLSKDEKLFAAFMESDPYVVLAKAHNLSRDEAKGRLIRSLYSLVDDDVLSCFPTLRKWIRTSSNKIDELGYSSSVLGRKFFLNNDNKLSIFNAQIQGSVAHSMQAVLCKLHPAFTPYLFTEIHDSLAMVAPSKFVHDLIHSVVPFMLRPLDGLLENPPNMVVRVSIGDAWKKWREYRVFGQKVNKTGMKHEA